MTWSFKTIKKGHWLHLHLKSTHCFRINIKHDRIQLWIHCNQDCQIFSLSAHITCRSLKGMNRWLLIAATKNCFRCNNTWDILYADCLCTTARINPTMHHVEMNIMKDNLVYSDFYTTWSNTSKLERATCCEEATRESSSSITPLSYSPKVRQTFGKW